MANKNPYLKDRDILDQALEHSWGKTADAKAKEKAYNREYYQRHKEEILRRARQAGEGVQRTAQNAYNTARREAQGIRDAVNPQPRQYSNPKGWTRSENEVFNRVDSYDANRRALDDARKYRNLAKNTPGAAETERRYRNAMRARSQNAAAVNEALKDGRQLAPDSRFDSKLVRDAQNAYSKVRRDARNAKNAIDTAANNARAYIDNARGKNGRKSSSVDASSYELQARKDQASRNRQNKAAQRASARAAARTEQAYQLNADPKLRNGRFAKEALDNAAESQREAYEKSKMAKKSRNRAVNSAAAANAASNAANRPGYDTRYDTKLVRDFQNAKAKVRDINSDPGKYVNRAKSSAEKAAENAREEAKKRMKKWFKR